MSCCPTCGQAVPPHELLVSLDNHRAARNGVTVQLTPQEAELLFLLREKTGTASKYYLLDGLYGLFGDAPEDDGDGNLKVLISRLRQKIQPLNVKIETIHTRGYRLNELGHLNA